MKKCIIFGTTTFSKMLKEYLNYYTDYKVFAYVVNSKYKHSDNFDGCPIVEFENIENIYSPEMYTMFIGLGYKMMNDIRKDKYLEAKKKGYKIGSFIHPSVCYDMAQVGEGNLIFENVTLAYGVKIGDGNIIFNGCQISHETTIGNYNFLSAGAVLAGKVVVQNNCFLGINSSVRGNSVLKDYTLIGAGAYMNKSSRENGVYVPPKTKRFDKCQSKDIL